MKIITLLIVLTTTLSASISINDVLTAVEMVESSGNELAVNEKENALGCMQLRPIFVADYNRITGFNVKHERAFHRPMARHIAMTVWLHYSKRIDNLTVRHLAYIHNGGGSAWRYAEDPNYGDPAKRKKLETYYKKVLTQLPNWI